MSTISLLKSQIDFVRSKAAHTGLVAGFGSGKTEAAVAKIIIKKVEYPSVNVAYYLPTYNLIKDIALPRITNKLSELGLTFKTNQSDKFIEVFNYGQSIGKIIMRTMDNPHLIVGYEVGYSLIDECDVLPKSKMSHVFSQIIARNRAKLPGGDINRTDVVGTPEGFKWFYDFFVSNATKDKALIRARTKDNHHLPKDYVKTLEDSYTKEQLSAYLDGEFVNLTSGTVYYKFSRKDNDTDRIDQGGDLHIGMDFNITNMSAVVHQIDGSGIYAIDELIGLYDTQEMIGELQNRYKGRNIIVYPDASGKNRSSSGRSDVDQLREAGFTVRVPSKNPFVRDRVNKMNMAFCDNEGRRTYKVNTRACVQYTEALERQSYNKNGEPDKTTGFDHATDAGGYAIIGMGKKRTIGGSKLNPRW